MSFSLSKRSRRNLEGVDPALVGIVKLAIKRTEIDFAVTEGVRTLERQKILFEKGATKTLDSKHLTGRAVDLVAYLDGRISWEVSLYDEIAAAMRSAAIDVGQPLRWGGSWTIWDIRDWDLPIGGAMQLYIDQRVMQGKRPFIDAPHFELVSI